MNFSEAMEYISRHKRFGVKSGLERMELIVKQSGLWERICKIRFIHIAGTNGKGSAAAMCASVLCKAGYNTGLYVSPYVDEFNERISVSGVRISDGDFASCVEFFVPFTEALDKERYGDFKEFELITLAALKYFCDKACEYVVFEVGIGGRLDATNIILPFVSLIMSISLDHEQQLGDTIRAIASEKCGIIKENAPTVCYPLQSDEAFVEIKSTAESKGSRLYVPSLPENIRVSDTGTEFTYEGEDYKTSLVGIHQAYNCSTVIKTFEVMRTLGLCITKEQIKNGVAELYHSARLEILSRSPLVILDGAHNEGGARALSESIKLLCSGKKRIFVMGMCADHIKGEVFEGLISEDDTVYASCVRDTPRAASPEELAQAIAPYCGRVFCKESLSEALTAALSHADAFAAVICCGSLFIASEIKKYPFDRM